MKKVMVPVVDKNNKPLMPTTCWRASKWIKSRKATPFWKHGIFCVRLNVEPSARNMQPIAVGIDPGSKREAFTVKSKKKTYLNILTHAVDWVKKQLKYERLCGEVADLEKLHIENQDLIEKEEDYRLLPKLGGN